MPTRRRSVRTSTRCRLFREIDDALLRLRFNYPEIGLVLIKSAGDLDRVAELDRAIWETASDWFINETLLLMKRVLKRLDPHRQKFFRDHRAGFMLRGFDIRARARRRPHLYEVGRGRRIATGVLNAGRASDEQWAKPSRHAFHRRPGARRVRSPPAARLTRRRRWRRGW